MTHDELAAARRRNTIAELTESMRAAQRRAMQVIHELDDDQSPPPPVVIRMPGRVGVWKGGCR